MLKWGKCHWGREWQRHLTSDCGQVGRAVASNTQGPGSSPVIINFYWTFFLKNGPIPASFCLCSLFSQYNFNNTNWKKRRWCAWDSNPGPQDGRCRRKQGAMAATLGHLFAIDFILKMSIKKEDSSNGPFYTEITVTYIITLLILFNIKTVPLCNKKVNKFI